MNTIKEIEGQLLYILNSEKSLSRRKIKETGEVHEKAQPK